MKQPRELDVCLILHADHTFNASTFVPGGCVHPGPHVRGDRRRDRELLSGSLHGGANAEVMKMLLELESERDIPGWVKARLDKGERIMGMGHAATNHRSEGEVSQGHGRIPNR